MYSASVLLSFWQTEDECCAFIKNHNQYRFTCLCKLLIVFLCFLLFFGLLLLGTSRSIRRSRPTWTTWQESKPEAVKTHFKLFASLVWFQLQSTIDQSDGPIVTVVIADKRFYQLQHLNLLCSFEMCIRSFLK